MLVRITFELADKDKNIYQEIKNSFFKEGFATADRFEKDVGSKDKEYVIKIVENIFQSVSNKLNKEISVTTLNICFDCIARDASKSNPEDFGVVRSLKNMIFSPEI